MSDYGNKYGRPIGASRDAFGGAGLNLPVGCLEGEGDMIYTFDDFNGFVAGEAFDSDGILEDTGWTLAQDGTPTDDLISMNDAPTVTSDFDSCLRIFPGTDGDQGGNMQLDMVNGTVVGNGEPRFPHIWIPEDAAVPSTSGVAGEVLDNTTWVFACRIGLRADLTTTSSGNFDGKVYIGWAEAGATTILTETGVTMATPIITQAETGPMVGFCIPEDGSINGISQRTSVLLTPKELTSPS